MMVGRSSSLLGAFSSPDILVVVVVVVVDVVVVAGTLDVHGSSSNEWRRQEEVSFAIFESLTLVDVGVVVQALWSIFLDDNDDGS
jgi:hypothetical protein